MINLNNNIVIKQLYDQLSDQLLLIFSNMEKNPNFDLDKNKVLISFDAYFQCIMVKAVLHKRSFEVGEVNYIKNIVKFSDYFKEYNIIRDTYPSKEVEETLYKVSTAYINVIPDVATMSLLVDREIESSILKSKITFSRILYDCYKEVISIIIDDIDDPYAEKILRPMKEFFIRQHVLDFTQNE